MDLQGNDFRPARSIPLQEPPHLVVLDFHTLPILPRESLNFRTNLRDAVLRFLAMLYAHPIEANICVIAIETGDQFTPRPVNICDTQSIHDIRSHATAISRIRCRARDSFISECNIVPYARDVVDAVRTWAYSMFPSVQDQRSQLHSYFFMLESLLNHFSQAIITHVPEMANSFTHLFPVPAMRTTLDQTPGSDFDEILARLLEHEIALALPTLGDVPTHTLKLVCRPRLLTSEFRWTRDATLTALRLVFLSSLHEDLTHGNSCIIHPPWQAELSPEASQFLDLCQYLVEKKQGLICLVSSAQGLPATAVILPVSNLEDNVPMALVKLVGHRDNILPLPQTAHTIPPISIPGVDVQSGLSRLCVGPFDPARLPRMNFGGKGSRNVSFENEQTKVGAQSAEPS